MCSFALTSSKCLIGLQIIPFFLIHVVFNSTYYATQYEYCFSTNGKITKKNRKITKYPRLLLMKMNLSLVYLSIFGLKSSETANVKILYSCLEFSGFFYPVFQNLTLFLIFLPPAPTISHQTEQAKRLSCRSLFSCFLLVKSANRIHLDKVKDCAFNVELSE